MKNKLLLFFALCTSLQFTVSLSSENPSEQSSLWQRTAPIWLQNKTTATADYLASWIPKSIRDTVNKWSPRKKVAVASAIVASLAAIYNREAIMAMVNNAITSDTSPTTPSSTTTTSKKEGSSDPFSVLSEFRNTLSLFESSIGLYRGSFDDMKPEAVAQKKAQALREDYRENPTDTLQIVRATISDYDQGTMEKNQTTKEIMRAIYIFLTETYFSSNLPANGPFTQGEIEHIRELNSWPKN